MTKDQILKEKARAKRDRPEFVRTDAHKKIRVKKSWRRPNGIQNKVRLHKKGYRMMVRPGYRGPALVRGTNALGLAIVTVHNLAELSALDPKSQAALIAGVGRKKKEELIAQAKVKKLTIVNLSTEKYLEKTKKVLSEKKDRKDSLKAKVEAHKAKDAKKADKQAAEKKQHADAESADADEKKAEEKKEKDKLLTSKDSGY